MKLRELIKQLQDLEKQRPDIMDYDVYLEQCTESDKEYKRTKQNWEIHKSQACDFDDEWEYFKVHGFNTIIPDKKIVTININF